MLQFSVIVPTYHRNEHLARCLERLAPGAQTLPAEEYEVIVTDDGSATTSQAMVRERFPWIRWVAGPRRGPAANRNNGVAHAKGKWLVFIDDDCVPDRIWLNTYAEATLLHPECRAFEGRTYVDEPRQSLADISPINNTGNRLYSCNLMLHVSLYAEMHGFDERFRYAAMEDLDFAFRLRVAGEKDVFVPTAAVCHPWRNAGGWRQLQRRNDGVLTYLSLHPTEADHMNTRFYCKAALSIFLRNSPKAIYHLDGRGFGWTCQEMISTFLLAARLVRRR